MSGVEEKILFKERWQKEFSEYINAITWSPHGLLAVSTAAGEVIIWHDGKLVNLLPEGLDSIDCLDFSGDGKFLAAGGQDGKIRVWSIPNFPLTEQEVKLVTSLDNDSSWIDKLTWSPNSNHLAFSYGRYVQIWDADTHSVVATLPFANSSVLDLAWRPNGENIAIAGNGGVKIWSTKDWDDDPYFMDTPSASTLIAWSKDSKYIASASLDNTIRLLEYGSVSPWVMQGFPGKVSNLAWSQIESSDEPWLVASSLEIIAIWQKETSDEDIWNARGLDFHQGKVQALEFHPQSLLLASAADDNYLCLWTEAKELGQILEGAQGGFSCLAWSYDGRQLAAGGQDGELFIWSESKAG